MSRVTLQATNLVSFKIAEFGKTGFRKTDKVRIITYIEDKVNSDRWYRLSDTNNITITLDGEME